MRLFVLLTFAFVISYFPAYSQVINQDIIFKNGIAFSGDGNNLFTGEYIDYYPSGNIQSKTLYNNGKENGLYEVYRDSGQIESRGEFKDGEKNGVWEEFWDNGKLWTSELWEDGELITAKRFTRDGDQLGSGF